MIGRTPIDPLSNTHRHNRPTQLALTCCAERPRARQPHITADSLRTVRSLATLPATDVVSRGYRLRRRRLPSCSLLGQGAMGAVYLAEDTANRAGRRWPSSCLRLSSRRTSDSGSGSCANRSSRPASSIRTSSPSSARGRGRCPLPRDSVLQGLDLRELLRRDGPLEPERALRLVGQVADALDAAHAAGLVHRDVKPGNILVAENDHAYVCDFGLARHVTSVSSLTGDRGFVGTIDYVPPEQIKGGEIDGRADLYALGCVLYECLAGTRPFERDSELAVVYAHLNQPPPRLSDADLTFPEAFDAVFQTVSPSLRMPATRRAASLPMRHRAALRAKPSHVERVVYTGSLLAVVVRCSPPAMTPSAASSRTHARLSAIRLRSPQTALGGSKLGLSADTVHTPPGATERDHPAQVSGPNYAKRTFAARKVGRLLRQWNTGRSRRSRGIVEFTTWNKYYRTETGVGPCSTLDELKPRTVSHLEPVEANIIEGKVVPATRSGNHLFFASSTRTHHRVSRRSLCTPIPCSSQRLQCPRRRTARAREVASRSSTDDRLSTS